MSGGLSFECFAIHEIASSCRCSAEVGSDLSRMEQLDGRKSKENNPQNNWMDTWIRSFLDVEPLLPAGLEAQAEGQPHVKENKNWLEANWAPVVVT